MHNIINDDICMALQNHVKNYAHIKTTKNSKCSETVPKSKLNVCIKIIFYMKAR